jgi:hypothetical protein
LAKAKGRASTRRRRKIDFGKGRSAGTAQAHREPRTCAQSSSEQGQGRLRPDWPDITFFLITGQVGYKKEVERLNPPVIIFIGKNTRQLANFTWLFLVT